MGRPEKTVFISYRRKDIAWALAIYQALSAADYDVFFDFQSVTHGDFERAILSNILTRAHFIVLLTPSALDRCGDPRDWVRREIETALEARRNVVPVLLEDFDFTAAQLAGQLIGKLAMLGHYNGLRVHADYFQAAITRLREHLEVPLEAVLHPVSPAVEASAQEQMRVASEAPPVRPEELSALEWFRRGFVAMTLEVKQGCYDLAIEANGNFAAAYRNRAQVRLERGDNAGAIEDCTQAIRIAPRDADAHTDRGIARARAGDHAGAIADFTAAIRIAPSNSDAYNRRGIERTEIGELELAIRDYSAVIDLQPDGAPAYFNRALALARSDRAPAAAADFDRAIELDPTRPAFFSGRGRFREAQGDVQGAVQDHTRAIRLRPDDAQAYFDRASARRMQQDLEGADSDYSEAIRLSPQFAAAYFNRALVRQSRAEFEAAISDYREYLDSGSGELEGDGEIVEQTIRRLQKKLGR
ncbi:hypothetical protein BH11PSE8_BH11PSE8_00210 [soil metagenome]